MFTSEESPHLVCLGFPGGSDGKVSVCNSGDLGSIPGSRIPPQLEKNHVVPTSWQDEALSSDGFSREVPCSALKGETVPDITGLRVQ